MDIFEFELRYKAYAGLNRICKLWRDSTTIIDMVRLSSKWTPEKALQDISPEELKTLTKATYTVFKHNYINKHSTFLDTFTKDEFHYPLSDYIERLEYELKVIKEMWFNTYMLVVSDFTTRSKNNSIMVGPWRWSWAGSLLAYVIAITDVNPFAYDLLFERFLNPARISMPDFDIDFEDTLREKVVQYVTEKYGQDKVCAIGTYMKLATKAAFKDAARAIGIPFEKSNQVSNLMWEIKSLKDIINKKEDINEELKSFYDQDKYLKASIDQGAELEGNLRQLWVHACGVIISPDPITEHTATQIITKGKEHTLVSQFDWPTLEYIWLLKMDFLWLRNLSVIKNCIKILRAKYRNIDELWDTIQLTLYKQDQKLFDEFVETMSFNPDMNNQEVFEKVFMTGDTTWIFQFEWEGIRRFLIDLKPNHINDLVAMNALYRPWPLEFIPSYINRKHWEESIEYMLPELMQILNDTYKSPEVIQNEKAKLEEDLWPIMWLTYWIAVYQEQLMFLVQAMAWFSLPEADLLRRWIGKKKKEVIEQIKKEFIIRAESYKQYKPETSKFIYEKMIEPAASYSFNKSHAVCYAHIAYQTWYLKARYPVEFYASLLRSVEEDTDKLWLFIDEIQLHNIKIFPPYINKAYNHIAALEDSIIMWFYACKGIGYEIWDTIEQERKMHGPFSSLGNFLERCPIVSNKRVMESLIKSWAFDERYDRNTLLINLNVLLEWHKTTSSLDMGLFWWLSTAQELVLQQITTTSVIERCKYDMETFKNMISWHPLDGLYLYCKKFWFIEQYKKSVDPCSFEVAVMVKKITRAKKKGFFIMVEDITDSFEFFVKEILDIKVYDILILSWYKSRNRWIDTMVKISIEKFTEQATKSGKFDPQWTVAKVRAWRKIKIKDTLMEHNTDNKMMIEEDNKQANIDEHTIDQNLPLEIPLPDSIEKINTLIEILRAHTGDDHIVIINNKEHHITAEWMQRIHDLN